MAHSVPPAGSTPASAYGVDTSAAPEPPVAILADPVDLGGEWLSLLKSAKIADGMVREALAIERATGAAVRDLGQRFRKLRHIEDQTEEVVDAMVREAFAAAIESGAVALVSVLVETDSVDPSQLNAAVEYRDRLAKPGSENERIVFPLPKT